MPLTAAQRLRVILLASLLSVPAVSSLHADTIPPSSVSGGTGSASDLQDNDASSYTVAKGASATISGFSAYGGAITSVYLFVEYAVDDGYNGTGALQLNGTDSSIVPVDGERVRQVFLDITGGSFGIDTSAEIESLSISFANNDTAAGDAVHFDYVYLVINPELPIHMPPTWSEEFNGTGLADPSIWWYEEGYQRNNELQYYTTSGNGWQTNGLFVIEGREEPMGGYDYTSASIKTEGNYSWMYGRAQIRAQLPCLTGMWPAIWMVGDDGEWPSNGECDIMEYYREDILANCARGTTTRWTAAWDSSHTAMDYLEAVDPGWRTNYHVWTIQWDEDNVRLFCDNLLLNTIPQSWLVNPVTTWGPLEPFKQPHSLWLNLAIGGKENPAGTPFPQRYYIDYWRVWEGATENSAPTDIAISSDSILEGQPIGTVVGDLSAIDADPAEVISYTLVAGTGDDDNAYFSIPDFASDRTDTLVLKTAAVLDYFDGATRSIRVRATDIEQATFEKVLTINVIPSLAIEVAPESVIVPEGGTTNVGVRLRIPPSNTVTVNVSRVSGDTDLSVQSGSTLYFTPANATDWQPVTLAAAEDADLINGAAVFTFVDPAGGYTGVALDASELENDLPGPPAAPAGLGIAGEDSSVRLDWNDNTEADLAGYSVYRSTASGTYGSALATGLSASEYVDNTAVNGTAYYYVVTASDVDGNESADSSEVSATPQAASVGPVISDIFGSNNDGLGGFTASTPANSNETWTTLADSVRYRNQNDGTLNSSLLKSYALNRSNGKSYTLQGVVEMTDGYADDNNRVGLYLFGDFAEVPNEDEAGAIGVIFNTDDGSATGPPGSNADDNLALRVGIDNTTLAGPVTRTQVITPYAQDLFTTEVTFKVDILYTNVSGTDSIQVTASLTDLNNEVTTVGPLTVAAADYTGDYFGFITRARARNYSIDPTPTAGEQSLPWVMSYKSFQIQWDTNAPLAPVGLVAAAGDSSVSLSWNNSAESDFDSYSVYRSTAPGSYGAALAAGLTSNSYVDSTAVNGTTYYYVVTASDHGSNESAVSGEVSATPGGAVLSGYDLWAFDHGIGDATNDFDSDGLDNLYEYGLDGNPTNALDQGTLPIFTNAGGAMLYIHPQRSDDTNITYWIETTTNLTAGTWTNEGYTVLGTRVTGEPLDFITNDVDTAEDEKFIRLKIGR